MKTLTEAAEHLFHARDLAQAEEMFTEFMGKTAGLRDDLEENALIAKILSSHVRTTMETLAEIAGELEGADGVQAIQQELIDVFYSIFLSGLMLGIEMEKQE